MGRTLAAALLILLVGLPLRADEGSSEFCTSAFSQVDDPNPLLNSLSVSSIPALQPGGTDQPRRARRETDVRPVAPPPPYDFRRALRDKGYQVLRVLGSGGEGVTFQVKKGDQVFIVKVLHSRPPEALRAEARLLEKARGSGEQASRFFSKGEIVELEADGSRPALVMGFFPRKPGSHSPAPTLADRLKDGTLTDTMRLKILDQMMDAFELMHARGVVHRDFKPENVLVDDEGNIRVIDFGLAAAPGMRPEGTREGYVSGTADYMSHNQWTGGGAHAADDLHALRGTAWRLLALGRIKPDAPEAVRREDAAKLLDHLFFRKAGDGYYPDFTHAPEEYIDPRLAVAIWARFPETVKEQREIILAARTLRPAEFYRSFGRRLAELPAEPVATKNWLGRRTYVPVSYRAAREILASKALIERFPDGLDLTKAKQDEIIRAVFILEKDAQRLRDDPDRIGPLEENPYLLFTEFRARLKELQREGKASRDSAYEVES